MSNKEEERKPITSC